MGGSGSGRPLGYRPRGGPRFRSNGKAPYTWQRSPVAVQRTRRAGKRGSSASMAEQFWSVYFANHPCEWEERRGAIARDHQCKHFSRDGHGMCRCACNRLSLDLSRWQDTREKGLLLREDGSKTWIREDCARTDDKCPWFKYPPPETTTPPKTDADREEERQARNKRDRARRQRAAGAPCLCGCGKPAGPRGRFATTQCPLALRRQRKEAGLLHICAQPGCSNPSLGNKRGTPSVFCEEHRTVCVTATRPTRVPALPSPVASPRTSPHP